MSIQPSTIRLNPFEGLEFVPPALRTTEPSAPVTVCNIDLQLRIDERNDVHGLYLLLGALGGVRPMGLQTEERVVNRLEFERQVKAARFGSTPVQFLGRISFFSIATPPPQNIAAASERIARSYTEGALLIIPSSTLPWEALKNTLRERVGVQPYKATFTRRNPPTRQGMKWTIDQ
ncbi:MAG: hypothetical protein WAQ24_03055 [Candidatus Saccharimonadales bacterium]